MNVQALQQALTVSGYACEADGQLGPMTYAALLSYASQRPLGQMGQALGRGMATAFPGFGITSDLQVVHWIAQATHETEGFRYFTELGNSTYFARYAPSTPLGRELGNTQPGDGLRYIGRGVFMITGRANYAHYGSKIGEPLEDNPGLAAQPGVVVKIACEFWCERDCGAPADADDCPGVTRLINGGLTGLDDRQAITDRLKTICGL